MSFEMVVIIVTYNGVKWIDKCLSSLRDSEHSTSVIVVDNNSKDNTVEIIFKNFPEVKVVRCKKNLGFGKANNVGIKMALKMGAKYVFLLNQDAFIDGNTIFNLVSASKTNPEYGILSPIHCVWEKDYLDTAFTNYISYKNNPDFITDFVLNKNKKEVYSIPFVAASGWLLTKKCIETVGGFDPIFFYLGEDVNYCQRVVYHGLKIGIVPNSKFYHDTKKRKHEKPRKKNKNYFDFSNKIKFANVLDNNLEVLIKNSRRNYKKKIVKYLVKFQFTKFKEVKAEYKQLDNIIKESLLSIKINKSKGANYI